MTHKERVITALNHTQPDFCPYNVSFTVPAAARMDEHYGDGTWRERIGGHFATMEPTPPGAWVEIRCDYWRDQFGVVWNRTVDKDIGNPDNRLLARGKIDAVAFPDPHDPARYERFPSFCVEHADDFLVGSIGFSLFERAWTLRGMEQLLIDMVTDAAFVERLLERITEWNLACIDHMCEYPLDAVHFGDDWGQQHGLIMGPDYWRKFIKPCVKRMYARVKSKGKFVSQHSCGDIYGVLGDLIDIGLDVFNPFQPEVADVAAVKKEYGKHLTFHGGISTQRTLPYAAPDEVRAEVRRLIETVGADGGYIAAPAHSIPGDVPVENLVAMIDELKNQGS